MKKVLALLLALLMLLPFAVACANTGDDTPSDTTAGEGQSNEQNGTGEYIDVPNQNYNSNMTFLSQYDGGEWSVVDIYTSEKSSDNPIKEAIWQRNLYLQDNYGVTIKEQQESDVFTTAKTEISSGSQTYDAYACSLSVASSLAAQKNYLYDLNSGDVPYINLEKSWWDQDAVSGLSIGGMLFFATGDILTVDNDATFILMFNKTMVENASDTLESPYDLVENNEWTLEKFQTMAELAKKDLDGQASNSDSYKVDQFGLAGGQEMVLAFFYGSNMTSATKDSDDIPVFALSAAGVKEKAENYFAWAKSVIYNNETTVVFHEVGDKKSYQDAMDCFTTNRALFYGECLQCVTRLRQYAINFGIIPYPKYDTAQDNYYGYVNTVAQVVCVPTTNSEHLEMTGAMLEVLAAKSQELLTEAYYERNLVGKGMKDEESRPMLEIILNHRIFDLGYVYNWGNSLVSSNFFTLAKKGGGFSSKAENHKRKYNNSINKTLEAFGLK